MSGGSEVTSDRTPSVHISSDNDLSSHSRLEYMASKDSSVFNRKSTSNPPSEEASPSGQRLREIVLPDDCFIHDFLVDMSDEMDSMKNKQAVKNRQEEIKKVAALRAQSGGLLVLPPNVFKRRKHASNVQSSGKGGSGSSTRLETRKDADLDECSEHETDPLGDFVFYDMMREVIDLKDGLVKENANMKSEVVVLYEHMGKVKEETIKEYQVSQSYFNEMGGYYGDGFEDFYKQTILMFPSLDFSQIQIKVTTLTTLTAEPNLDDADIDDEVLVTNRPTTEADNPKGSNDQPTNTLTDA
nr:hypothetical protein CFP56_71360 [Quercus suber]